MANFVSEKVSFFVDGIYNSLPEISRDKFYSVCIAVFNTLSTPIATTLNLSNWIFTHDSSSSRTNTFFKDVTRKLPNLTECLEKGNNSVELDCLSLDQVKEFYCNDPDQLAYDALLAFKSEKISQEQFSTFTFLYSVLKELSDKDLHSIKIFDERGEVSQHAKEIIESTFILGGVARTEKEAYLSESELKAFYKKLYNAPESEQRFYFIETSEYTDDLDIEGVFTGSRTISEEIAKTVGINVFQQFKFEGKTYRMVPSYTMMQEALNAKAKDNAVAITPVIGLSTVNDIRSNGITGTRDMALPFPTVELPKEADMLGAPYSIDFIFHDFYHAIVASFIPQSHREAFIAYADIIKKCSSNFDPGILKLYFDELHDRIIDMEHSFYQDYVLQQLPEELKEPALKFILSAQFQQANALGRVAIIAQRHSQNNDIEQLLENMVEIQIIQKLAEGFVQERLHEKIGIKKELLTHFCDFFRKKLEDNFAQFKGAPFYDDILEKAKINDLSWQILQLLK